jgi:hypothetical protein
MCTWKILPILQQYTLNQSNKISILPQQDTKLFPVFDHFVHLARYIQWPLKVGVGIGIGRKLVSG